MASEFGLSPDQVADEMPLGKLFAYQAWCMENDAWAPMERDTDGYVAQEVAKRLEGESKSKNQVQEQESSSRARFVNYECD